MPDPTRELPTAEPTRDWQFAVADGVLRGVEVGTGSGTPVLVLHGGPGESFDSLRPWLDPIATSERRLIFYDRRGEGRSSSTCPPCERFGDHARDVVDVCVGLGGPVDVFAFSWGTLLLAAALAAESSPIRRCVFCSPVAFSPFDATDLERIRAAEARPSVAMAIASSADPSFARRVAPYLARPADVDLLRPTTCDPEAATRGEIERPNELPARSLVPERSLVIRGVEDPMPLSPAAGLARQFECALVSLAGCGHAPFAESPRPFLEAVLGVFGE